MPCQGGNSAPLTQGEESSQETVKGLACVPQEEGDVVSQEDPPRRGAFQEVSQRNPNSCSGSVLMESGLTERGGESRNE